MMFWIYLTMAIMGAVMVLIYDNTKIGDWCHTIGVILVYVGTAAVLGHIIGYIIGLIIGVNVLTHTTMFVIGIVTGIIGTLIWLGLRSGEEDEE